MATRSGVAIATRAPEIGVCVCALVTVPWMLLPCWAAAGVAMTRAASTAAPTRRLGRMERRIQGGEAGGAFMNCSLYAPSTRRAGPYQGVFTFIGRRQMGHARILGSRLKTTL